MRVRFDFAACGRCAQRERNPSSAVRPERRPTAGVEGPSLHRNFDARVRFDSAACGRCAQRERNHSSAVHPERRPKAGVEGPACTGTSMRACASTQRPAALRSARTEAGDATPSWRFGMSFTSQPSPLRVPSSSSQIAPSGPCDLADAALHVDALRFACATLAVEPDAHERHRRESVDERIAVPLRQHRAARHVPCAAPARSDRSSGRPHGVLALRRWLPRRRLARHP